jgi:SAM-dependent methyltransferase
MYGVPTSALTSGGNQSALRSACKICGNGIGNREHRAQENMFGSREEFPYLECGSCGCLQLVTAPADIARYYPDGYYSFGSHERGTRLTEYIRTLKNRSYFGPAFHLGRFWDARHPYLQLRAFSSMKVSRNARILDVGCGSGRFVSDLFSLGFRNVLGIDPFIESDIEYGGRVAVRKCSLNAIGPGAWDVVMFHHSFEHIQDPRETLETVRSLLAPNGRCLIRVPVVSWAWNQYGVNWVQIDAPRHFFLHTEKSMGILAKKVGLAITRVECDSTEFQFWGSELSKRGVACGLVRPESYFSGQELADFRTRALQLNAEHRGDQAAFHLGIH